MVPNFDSKSKGKAMNVKFVFAIKQLTLTRQKQICLRSSLIQTFLELLDEQYTQKLYLKAYAAWNKTLCD